MYPMTLHLLIEEIFDKLGVKRKSTVTFLRAGISEDIMNKVSDSIKIEYDQTTY